MTVLTDAGGEVEVVVVDCGSPWVVDDVLVGSTMEVAGRGAAPTTGPPDA